jgi:hypothetical protein
MDEAAEDVFDKTVTPGEVEDCWKVLLTALVMLEEEHSIGDAKAICKPDVLCHF